MPVLPDKYALGNAPELAVRGASLIDTPKVGGAALVGAQIAESVGKFAGVVQAKRDEEDKYEVQKRVIEFDLEQEKKLDIAQREAAPAAKGFTESYRKSYDEDAIKLMDGIPARHRPAVDAVLVRRGAGFEKRAHDFELKERDLHHNKEVRSLSEGIVHETMSNPDMASANEDRGRSLIRRSLLPERDKADLEKKFRETNAEFAVLGEVDRAKRDGDWAKVEEIKKRLREIRKGSMPPETPGMATDPATREGVGSGTAKAADGGDVLGSAYQFFADKGLEPHQAAALAGNFRWESGGKPDLVNPNDNRKNSPRSPHSIGVGQWNDRAPALIEFARKAGVDVPDGDLRDVDYARKVARAIPLATQLDFAWSELNSTEKRAFDKIKSASDLKSATEGAISYHRPAGWTRNNPSAGHGFSNRLDLATQATRLPAKSPDAKGYPYTVEDPAPKDGAADPSRLPDAKDKQSPYTVEDPTAPAGQDGKGQAPKDGAAAADGGGAPDNELGYRLTEVEDDPTKPRPRSHYDSLTPMQRRKLLAEVDKSARGHFEGVLKDDIARVQRGGTPKQLAEGKTALDLYRGVATRPQYEKAKADLDFARLEYEEIGKLRYLPPDKREEHIAGIIDRRGGTDAEGLARATKLQERAQKANEALAKLIEKDGAAVTEGVRLDDNDSRKPPLPHVMRAMQKIRESRRGVVTSSDRPVADATGPMIGTSPAEFGGGAVRSQVAPSRLTPVQERELIIEARLRDQSVINPDRPELHRHITRAEAAQLLSLPAKAELKNDDTLYQSTLKKAASRAERDYGKYAKQALADAFAFHLSDKEHDSTRDRLLRSIVTGEPILRDDLRKAAAVDAIDRNSLANLLNPNNIMRNVDRVGRGVEEPARGVMDGGRPAIAGPSTPPAQFPAGPPESKVQHPDADDIMMLRSNPGQWEMFDRKFGPGASARVLGNPASDAYKKKLPKLKEADREKFRWSERKRGWLDFGG